MERLSKAALAAVGAMVLCAGCGKETPAGAAAFSPSAPTAASAAGPVSVTTVRAQTRDVDVVLEATGTVMALNSVEIRSQVSSVITRVNIREGQYVKAGETLFTLDARTDEVNLAKAKAQLAKDMAALADAQRQLARSRDLLAQGFISQGAVDTNQTLVDSQQAVVVADQAAIDAARVGLGYNRITAPSAGRAGAINVFAGTTVQPGGAALVTITQLDPIAVGFNLPQRHLDDALRTMRAGGGKVIAELPERRKVVAGKLQFVDNAVDLNSGTVRVKAQFDNRDEALWPGAFVTVRFAVRTLKGAIVVPQAAIIQSPRGAIVYLLDAQNKAVARPVEQVYASGLDAVVTGVASGERIVVDGRQNLRPGASAVERVAGEAAAGGRDAGADAASTAASGTAVGPVAALGASGAPSAAAP